MRLRKVRSQHNCSLEIAERATSIGFVYALHSLKIQILSFSTDRQCMYRMRLLPGCHVGAYFIGKRLCQFALKSKYVTGLTHIAVSPNGMIGPGIDEIDSDPDLVAIPEHGALDDAVH